MWLADFPHDLPELIMSMGLTTIRPERRERHRLSSAAAGTEMYSMEEGIGVPSQRRVHAFPWTAQSTQNYTKTPTLSLSTVAYEKWSVREHQNHNNAYL